MSKLSKSLLGLSFLSVVGLGLAGCASGTSTKSSSSNTDADKSKAITVVFYPNESAKSFSTSRDALKKSIEKATGKTVKLQTTTDYNVAIQAISSGKAQLAYMGANGYIQAHHLSKDVVPFAAQSDAEGTLKKATYNSYLMVQQKDAKQYEENGKYSIKNVKGKKMSYVSNSSTSGFLIPTAELTREFNIKDTQKLSQSGDFFSKVLYGGSHQGSAVNLLKGDADVAAFDDADLMPYLKATEGSWDKVGSTFTVKDDAEAPFNSLKGKSVVNIAMMPVQQGPWVYNTKTLSKTDQKKIADEFTSKEFANNEKIFSKPGAKKPSMFPKKSEKTQLIKVTDKWYAPTHKLVGY
ncbi:phosphate/phosphite/phosphonate ABC transporter substrate-binding protein [Lactiplantibacillus modestisalitolerans]|uniref:Phosphate/phosphite/phosphonate ABC transporter substrate-binding protein n=1 Tax=Lactiplantibacillus modestisalitolerans TaxID=1457219 RepID=A0ABV5WQE6_9LACO|nr:phosphate/phosphite/phosphonate ABC transporter substrate-binding protein [Lactiplantibacillus modestisalitolerans]